MESDILGQPRTFRVENIPPGTTADGLKDFFDAEDRPCVQVRSIAPAVDSDGTDVQHCTATVTFQPTSSTVLSPRVLDDSITIDSDFHGFTPLNHPQEPIAADIIAVAGLAAHAFDSWAHSARNMWLRDYLSNDISNARILIYGYPSQLQGNSSKMILFDHSTKFIHRLLGMRESAKCEDRPIVFVGHDLGCLIIKRTMLMNSEKAICDINGSVGIYDFRLPVQLTVFLGAPHRGLHVTALEALVKSQPSEDIIRELKAESPTLTDLNDKFRYAARDIEVLTCYETSPTKTVIQMSDGSWKQDGPPEMMVSLDSARQFHFREQIIPCYADHSHIAKLKRGERSIYPSVEWAIKKAVLTARDSYRDADPYRNPGTNEVSYGPENAHQGSVGTLGRFVPLSLASGTITLPRRSVDAFFRRYDSSEVQENVLG